MKDVAIPQTPIPVGRDGEIVTNCSLHASQHLCRAVLARVCLCLESCDCDFYVCPYRDVFT